MENQNQQTAPNAVASLVLGILSLLSGCFSVGLILGIIGLVLANSGIKKYQASPTIYTGEGMLKAGKITSLLGVILGGITFFFTIIYMIAVGGSYFALLDYLGLM